MLFPDFIEQKRGSAIIWIARQFGEKSFVDLLEDSDRLFEIAQSEIIKDQKKTKVGRIKIKIGHGDRSLYVKRYNAFSFRYKCLSLFQRSGALRSLCGTAILNRAEFQTAKPVAAVENRVGGVLVRSFFLSEEVPGSRTVDRYWVETLLKFEGSAGMRKRRLFLSELAELFRSLHAMHIYHNDLKDANILVTTSEEAPLVFYLVDLEGVKRLFRLNQRRQIKNLVQLYRTLGIYLRRVDKLYFFRRYAGSMFRDRKWKRRVIHRVMGMAGRLDTKGKKFRSEVI